MYTKKQVICLSITYIKTQHIYDNLFAHAGNLSADEGKHLRKEMTRLCSNFEKRWAQAHRTKKTFELKNKNWLSSLVFSTDGPSNFGGRPRKPFMELNTQNKRRRVACLRELGTPQELALAAEMNAREEGFADAAKVLQEAMQTNLPVRQKFIRLGNLSK